MLRKCSANITVSSSWHRKKINVGREPEDHKVQEEHPEKRYGHTRRYNWLYLYYLNILLCSSDPGEDSPGWYRGADLEERLVVSGQSHVVTHINDCLIRRKVALKVQGQFITQGGRSHYNLGGLQTWNFLRSIFRGRH